MHESYYSSPLPERAFLEDLYCTHYAKLIFHGTRLCYQYAHSIDLAEDLVSDAFLKAFDGKLKIDTQSKEKAFSTLKQKVRSNLIDYYRKECSLKNRAAIFLDQYHIQHTTLLFDLCSEMPLKRLLQQIEQCLKNDLEARLIIAYLKGYTFKEMALSFNLPQNTVATKVYKARNILRIKLRADRFESISK